MAKPFDITVKDLLDDCAPDWVRLFAAEFDLPPTAAVTPLEVELAADPLMADKVFRLDPPETGILHIEPQASWDGKFPERLHAYNAALDLKYGHPVYTVAVLLRPEANSSSLTGELVRVRKSGRRYDAFEYAVVRVWELSADELLAGGIGTLPLALLTNDARGRLGELVDRLDARLDAPHVAPTRRERILIDSYILCGLRYTKLEIETAFTRARGMKESVTYQGILRDGREEGMKIGLEKGREEGTLIARRNDVLRILKARFGSVPGELEAKVNASLDAAALETAVVSAATAAKVEDVTL